MGLPEDERTMSLLANPFGDLDWDGEVDEEDLEIITADLGKCRDDVGYDLFRDMNADGCIDALDTTALEASIDERHGPTDSALRSPCGVGAPTIAAVSLCVLGLAQWRRRWRS